MENRTTAQTDTKSVLADNARIDELKNINIRMLELSIH